MTAGEPPTGPIVGVGGVALDDDGRLLVVRRRNPPAKGRWTLPGGKVEDGETLTAAVAREVAEETGLAVEVGDLVGVAERAAAGRHYVILDYRVRVVGGDLRAGDDAAEVSWMSRGELLAVETTEGLVEFLDAHAVPLAP